MLDTYLFNQDPLGRRWSNVKATATSVWTCRHARRGVQRVAWLCCLVLFPSLAYSQTAKAPLLHVSRGQAPNDSGLGKTRWSIEHNSPLDGPALKVVFADGDSFGMNNVGLRNWSGHSAIEFDVFNPNQGTVQLELHVKHRRTTDFRSRVVVPLKLKPGKNPINISLVDLQNTDGSEPELSRINHWFFYSPDTAPILYFGNIWLAGGKSTVASPAAKQSLKSDPARLRRIRSATMPKITQPVEFYSPTADQILTALEVFPPDNAWNTLVEDWPVHPNSRNIVASIGNDKPLRYNTDMSFILVPPDQPRVDVNIVRYPNESDRGPYPAPPNTPIEGWPGRSESLVAVQKDSANRGGDRHAIVVDPTNRILYEFYQMKRTARGWQASQASIWDLKSNKLRPEGWTSADAAGLPIFPAVIRYDELQRGVIDHAMRVTVRDSRRAYVHPATHFASPHNNPNFPRMGERLRLRKSFDIRGFSPPVRAILRGLQRYGMIVADNGIEWAISCAPDPRIPILHEELRKVRGSDFEVVVAPQ